MEELVRDILIGNTNNRRLGLPPNYDPNNIDGGETLLMIANQTNNPLLYTELLIKDGANPNIVFPEYGTALHYAVVNNNIETIEYLLQNGANPFLKDGNNETPYDLAIVLLI